MKVTKIQNSFDRIIKQLEAKGEAEKVSHEITCRIDKRIADVFEKAKIKSEQKQRRLWASLRNRWMD